MNIVIIGGGTMGQAFVRGITSTQVHECFIIEKDSHNSLLCEQLGAKTFFSLADYCNHQRSESIDVIIIAVKPQDIEAVASDIQNRTLNNTMIVSIAAGISLESLQKLLGDYPIIRVMPNIAASELQSATAMCSNKNVSQTNESLVREILATLGSVIRVDENQMNLVTAISGSGPAYFFFLAEQMVRVAMECGMEDQIAHELVVQTFIGAATMARTNSSFSQLRERVTSKGGTTNAALEKFMDEGFEGVVSAGILAAVQRSDELNQQSGQNP